MITEFPGFPTQATRSSHRLCVFFHYTTPTPPFAVIRVTLRKGPNSQALDGLGGLRRELTESGGALSAKRKRLTVITNSPGFATQATHPRRALYVCFCVRPFAAIRAKCTARAVPFAKNPSALPDVDRLFAKKQGGESVVQP